MSQRATVTTTDGITLITMPNVPADIDFVAKIFENISNSSPGGEYRSFLYHQRR